MALNLVQHRGEPDVWADKSLTGEWDTERWLAAVVAGALLVSGIRRRTTAGLLLVIAGCSLGWWAASGIELRQRRRGRLIAALPGAKAHGDPVLDASEDSFPASDPPSWTPMTGKPVPAHDKVPLNR
jgi:hypothetical protein